MSATNEPNDSNPRTAAESEPIEGSESGPRRPKRRAGLWIAGLCVLLIFVAQACKPWADGQMMNMLSYVLGTIGVVAALAWTLRRDAPPLQRWMPAAMLAAALGLFLAFYEVVGVNGELVPLFAPRFAAPDPVAQKGEGEADLGDIDADDFPGFLGPGRDGVVARRAFSTDWSGAEELWRQSVGPGWSGFAIADGFAVTMEQRGEGETAQQWVTCYRIDDGQLVWYHASPGGHYHPLGGTGPRATPTIYRGKVYAQTAVGILLCLDGRTGKRLWQKDLLQRAGMDQATAEQAVTWGRAASPLIVETRSETADKTGSGALVVVPYGGPRDPQDPGSPLASLIALDADDGGERWLGGNTQISYASPVKAVLDGVAQIVSVNESNVTGHSIEDGRVLWETPWPGSSSGGASCSNPAIYQDDGVLLSKGYGGGSELLRIDSDAPADQRVDVEWSDGRLLKTKFTNVVLDGHYAYALSDGTLECVDLRGPQRMWRQPRGDRYGQGQLLRVEDCLVVQAEAGPVALVRCNPEAFEELARLAGPEGNTWNYPAVSGRHLLVRSSDQAVAYRLPPRPSETGRPSETDEKPLNPAPLRETP